jgi:hypothetical protein
MFRHFNCHHQGVNHDPAEKGAQCCINLKGKLKYIIINHTIYIYIDGALVGIIHSLLTMQNIFTCVRFHFTTFVSTSISLAIVSIGCFVTDMLLIVCCS